MQEEEVCLKENDEKMNKYLAEMDGYVESLEKNYQNVEKEIETLGNKNLLNFNEIQVEQEWDKFFTKKSEIFLCKLNLCSVYMFIQHELQYMYHQYFLIHAVS